MSSASSERGGRKERVRSTARSISLSFWLRKLLGWVVFDVALCLIALFIFAYRCNQSIVDFDLSNPFAFLTRMAFEGDGMSVSTWRYVAVTSADHATHSFYLIPALESVWPIPAFILLWQLLDLLHYFSDTRRVRRKLQQMRFVNDASHELRTPIAVIQGYVSMLDRWGKTDPQVLDESIEALKLESEHMQELVEQLLFLARGDSGRNTLQRQPMNLAQVVRDVWDESCMIDESHVYGCDLTEYDEQDQRFDMTGDVAMVKQSMRIIIQNAAKYSSAGSAIRLSASADASGVTYQVQDEGIGMSEKDASHIFERFYRADGARNEGAEGSGLGLSIAKWIVDAHGGTIEVLSREGVGTRFTVRFPRG